MPQLRRELVLEEVKTSRRGGRMTNDRAEILMRLEKRVEMLVSEIAEILMSLEKKGRNVSVRDRKGCWFG